MNTAQIYAGYVEQIDARDQKIEALEEQNKQLRSQLADAGPSPNRCRNHDKSDRVIAALKGIATPEQGLTRREVLAKCEDMTFAQVSTTLSNLLAQKRVAHTPYKNTGSDNSAWLQRFYLSVPG